MEKQVVIVGGGVIGLFTAFYLNRSGHQVTVIDQGDFKTGCSFGNAGMIVPSHVIPLAAPGMISQGIKWMFDSKSPFYVRPRLSKDLLSWGMQFRRSSTKEHVERSAPHLRDISLLSKSLYQELAQETQSFLYEEKGLLMLFRGEKMAEEEIEAGHVAQKLGLEVDVLSKEDVSQLETGTKTDVIGGVHYRSDAHLYPSKLIAYLMDSMRSAGVNFVPNTEVTDFTVTNGKITSAKTQNGEYSGDEFIIAGGAWSTAIAKKAAVKIPLLPGKGYSFTLNDKKGPTIPSILCEGKVAVTPMGNDLRFGGTMEITKVGDTAINMSRVQGILNAIHQFYPELEFNHPSKEDMWYGYRPCSPDGIPYIGRTNSIKNLIVATGHSMMGLSLGPATGKMVEALVNETTAPVEMAPYHPNRRL